MKIKKSIAAAAISFFPLAAPLAAQTLYVNGRIITVDASNQVAEALAVQDGKILAVGTTEEILKQKRTGSEVVDLQQKTVVPGFIDGHSHFMGLFRGQAVNLGSPPMGSVRNIADLVSAIQQFQRDKGLKEGEWIQGFGYDQDQLEEKRHPTKEDLDRVFPNTPVYITNINGHMGVANSAALKISGITSETADPAGGAIERKKGSQEPTGLLQESAKGLLKIPAKPKASLEQQLAELREQQLYYASRGITTAQDGYTSLPSLTLLKAAADRGALIIDIEALPGAHILDQVIDNPAYKFGELKNHLKLAGTKQIADGSPQGKTAYFSKPYLTDVPGCTHDECNGFPNITQEQFDAFILKTFQHNIRPFVHCNGDATIDMYLTAIRNANDKLGKSSNAIRPVTIHSQFVRPDQLDSYKDLGIIPAFFSNHAFFWGDVHTRNLGAERANFLSPLKTAGKKGIIATNHTDYPVTPIDQLFLLWTSVNRETRSGQIVGSEERLTPIEGLRAITINGAYQYQEESIKGSIEPGKLADLVILSADISEIDPKKIKDVEILETIKEGKSIYKKR